MQFIVVDFPAPFTPKKQKNEPLSTSKDIPFTATVSAYRFTNLLTLIAAAKIYFSLKIFYLQILY